MWRGEYKAQYYGDLNAARHPRMCGKRGNQAHRPPSVGDHPRARRGAQQRRKVHAWQAGIIPVCTGSTIVSGVKRVENRDHPRMHGEHACEYVAISSTTGSSPYARGAPGIEYELVTTGRIIPVCTGSTLHRTTRQVRNWDHPRMHGEHQRV